MSLVLPMETACFAGTHRIAFSPVQFPGVRSPPVGTMEQHLLGRSAETTKNDEFPKLRVASIAALQGASVLC